MLAQRLDQPIHMIMRSPEPLRATDSLYRAAQELRARPHLSLPVVDGDRFVGILTERSLGFALGNGFSYEDNVTDALEPNPIMISPSTTGAEALRQFEATGQSEFVVISEQGEVLGILSPSDFFHDENRYIAPPMVGGMATPFGVYLTTGSIHAGVQWWALSATGGLLSLLFLCATGVALWLGNLSLDQGLDTRWAQAIADYLPFILFGIGLRLIPLSGIHAAEHQTVNAIEHGEPLTLKNVSKMSRVHPRCGTNLAVGLSLFSGISLGNWTPYEDLRFITAVFVTMFFWRPLGTLAQLWVTTKKPNEKQLKMGIKAGTELLERYKLNRRVARNPFIRIYHSGMLQVIVGSLATYFIIAGIAFLLGYEMPL